MHGRISEQTRQGYLDAMGIQTWFPRKALPNALPPRVFEFPQEEAEQKESATPASFSGLTETPASPPGEGANMAKSLLGITPEKAKEEVKPPQPEVKAPAAEEKPAQNSQFRLVTLSPNEHCLVIAEMPHSGLNQFSRFHQRLLNDILLALDLPADQQQPPAMAEFVWPLGNQGLMGYMSRDDAAAMDAVCAYLSNQFGLARRKVVLLFGAAAARFVIDHQRTFEELRGIQPGLHSEQWIAATHGLNELMKLPSLKAEAWKDLSPLRKKLSS